MIQNYAWAITVTVMSLIAAAFLWVVFRSGGSAHYASIIQRGYRLRSWLFFALLTLGGVVSLQTLAGLPGPGDGDAQVVRAVGSQWYWELSQDTVVAGKPVDFLVTTTDVTHGFAIYDKDLHLVAQTQAMPGYTNVVHHQFDTPGTYKILCLEYCGLSHHNMMAEFRVVAP